MKTSRAAALKLSLCEGGGFPSPHSGGPLPFIFPSLYTLALLQYSRTVSDQGRTAHNWLVGVAGYSGEGPICSHLLPPMKACLHTVNKASCDLLQPDRAELLKMEAVWFWGYCCAPSKTLYLKMEERRKHLLSVCVFVCLFLSHSFSPRTDFQLPHKSECLPSPGLPLDSGDIEMHKTRLRPGTATERSVGGNH